jgi:hypothetical protein
MVGGGLGRFIETMTGSFYIYGVLVDLVMNNVSIKAFLSKAISWSEREYICGGTVSYVILGLMMVVQNASFTPGLDFPLYRLNQSMYIKGARGIIGESNYVKETEEVIDYMKNLLTSFSNNRKEMFVFPLNCMLYPLIGVKNPTTYDTLQSIPFIPEFIPDLIAQLKETSPEIIIIQKRATQATGPLRSEKVWVHQEVVNVVCRFVEMNYVKLYETKLHYEVYRLKRPQSTPLADCLID